MKTFAFISRHTPTREQIELANRHGCILVAVGDRDGFRFDPSEFIDHYDGIVCVHAMMALRASHAGLMVGVFANAARSADDAAFVPSEFHLQQSVVRVLNETLKRQSDYIDYVLATSEPI
jgi:hypothetical protein